MPSCEDRVPPGSAHAEAAIVVLEVVAHVELVQPAAETASRSPVMKRVVEHVVEQVSEEEPRGGRHPGARSERADEQREEAGGERDRDDGRHHGPERIVGVVVVDAVEDPVQPRAEPALRFEMEDRAVDPVLGEGPERISPEEAESRLPQRKASERECAENDDRGAKNSSGMIGRLRNRSSLEEKSGGEARRTSERVNRSIPSHLPRDILHRDE